MGNIISTVSWWDEIEKQKVQVFGPQISFNLQDGKGKSVLLFGEQHTKEAKEGEPCLENQKTFIELYESLVKRDQCEDLTTIIEMSEWKRSNLGPNPPHGNRIFEIMKNYYSYYPEEKKQKCNIELRFANPDQTNFRLARDVLELENFMKKGHKIYPGDAGSLFIRTFQENVKTAFNMFKNNKYNFMHRLNQVYRDLINETLIRNIDARIISCEEKIEKLQNTSTLIDMHAIFQEAYLIILQTMDIYGVIMTMSGHSSVLLYMGSIHILFITSYLIKHLGFKMIDASITVSAHCIKLDKSVSLGDKFKSMKNLYASRNNDIINSLVDDIFSSTDQAIGEIFTDKNDKMYFY